MSAKFDHPGSRSEVPAQPAPMWARAAVGAIISLIPSTLIAALIVVVALIMPLLLPARVSSHSTIRTGAFLIVCVYGLGMVYGAWYWARRRR
ncbi:MAG TPA: hypothetical protein PKE29_04440 [Phycisphaerales bacterium]|nr:hypothetical protein [Phycisphaerales bacterium]